MVEVDSGPQGVRFIRRVGRTIPVNWPTYRRGSRPGGSRPPV